jgi:hypothetical protein
MASGIVVNFSDTAIPRNSKDYLTSLSGNSGDCSHDGSLTLARHLQIPSRFDKM